MVRHTTRFGIRVLSTPTSTSQNSLSTSRRCGFNSRINASKRTIPVTHPILATSVTVLLPLILATASLRFHVPPSLVQARIGLGTTALLTLVAMQWSALSNLPDGGHLVMLNVL